MGPREWYGLLYGDDGDGDSAPPSAEGLSYMARVLARAAQPAPPYAPPKRSWWQRITG